MRAAPVLLLLSLLPAGIASGQAVPARWTAPPDTAAPSRDAALAAVREAIRGREQEPAEAVFKDIQILRGIPAGRIPALMETGFSRSLGVGCTHCHVDGAWERADSSRKAVAREMWRMMTTISGDLLPKIEGLRSRRPSVNCTTCHRGQTRPAVSLDQPGT